jgi:hypothetical protein
MILHLFYKNSPQAYVQHSCPIVRLVYPEKRIVAAYQSGNDLDLLVAEDTLSGGEVLPGFSLAVAVLSGG